MDPQVVAVLEEAGLDLTPEGSVPIIPVRVDEDGGALPHGRDVVVLQGARSASVSLKETSALFAGDRRPPDFSAGPTGEYTWFFLAIERAAADYCACTGERVQDRDFERVYGDLRRRPDRDGEDPLFAHLQATLRLYLSLRDVSEAEYESVLRRLARSARTFALGHTSTNYLDRALRPLAGGGR